jgi:hypothetical protein
VGFDPRVVRLELDAYAALGLTSEATAEQVRSAYRHLAHALHPDANPGDTAAAARFRQVAQAYQVLGDPWRRRQYDLLRAAPRPGPRAARHAPGPTGNVAVRGPDARPAHHARPVASHPVGRREVDEWSFLSAFLRWASVIALAAVIVIAIAAAVYGNDQPPPVPRQYTGSPGGPGFCHTDGGWVSCRLMSGLPAAAP